MRKAFITALCDIAKRDKRVFLITGDLGFRVLELYRDQFPDRFLNIGVAEANLVTVAAGLSTTGYIPFIYSIATFASMRPFEQIRNDVSLQNSNVKIVAIGAGLAYTKAGPTHHSMEDIAIMRTLPNMTIVAPIEPMQTESAVRAVVAHTGPVYLRLERNPEIEIFKKPPPFAIGSAYLVLKGRDIALLATGTKVSLALQVSRLLKLSSIHPAVYAFPTIAPLDARMLTRIARLYPTVVTIEEHRKSGGFGTAVLEFIQDRNFRPPPRVIRFGMKNEFTPISASYERMIAFHGLTAANIAASIRKLGKSKY